MKYLITEKDIELVDNASHTEACQWCEKLNNWGWPDVFDNPCTLNIDTGANYISGSRRSQLMSLIFKKVTFKGYLYHWNVESKNKGDMTKEEFEIFWNDFENGKN